MTSSTKMSPAGITVGRLTIRPVVLGMTTSFIAVLRVNPCRAARETDSLGFGFGNGLGRVDTPCMVRSRMMPGWLKSSMVPPSWKTRLPYSATGATWTACKAVSLKQRAEVGPHKLHGRKIGDASPLVLRCR